ncbi:uncharacterized protein BDR25DRAFT_360504 [Lindgomyces ingoldianus]|uniref:Uncharacterized protein n=1 Tax=Lindgomyces ingoldianus TaxID=673940 RepID=A0ACB6QG71_9PLEO|nr:uncharacterized protein BDR25DRAFT_360504 [Lindgomyces ingoldianus]KAF2465563.1 hypothetical protein BDR25DRAFT_360504 [Lindgomyces ingoldianus]
MVYSLATIREWLYEYIELNILKSTVSWDEFPRFHSHCRSFAGQGQTRTCKCLNLSTNNLMYSDYPSSLIFVKPFPISQFTIVSLGLSRDSFPCVPGLRSDDFINLPRSAGIPDSFTIMEGSSHFSRLGILRKGGKWVMTLPYKGVLDAGKIMKECWSYGRVGGREYEVGLGGLPPSPSFNYQVGMQPKYMARKSYKEYVLSGEAFHMASYKSFCLNMSLYVISDAASLPPSLQST